MMSHLQRSTNAIFLLGALIFFVFAPTIKSQPSPAEEEFALAARFSATGAFEESIPRWKRAGALFEQAGNSSKQVETEIHLAAAYHALGQTNLAAETLTHALNFASSGDLKNRAQIKAAL